MLRLKQFLIFISLLLLLVAGGMFYLLSSSNGIEILVQGLNRFGGNSVSIGSADGRLLGPLSIKELRVHVNGLIIRPLFDITIFSGRVQEKEHGFRLKTRAWIRVPGRGFFLPR